MAFTYVGDLSTDRDKVRFSLQDTVENKGPKPANGNFTDAEIDGLLAIEDSWQLAVAAGFETLAAAWAEKMSFSVVNGSFTRSDAGKHYMSLAKDWRDKHGTSGDMPLDISFRDESEGGKETFPLFQRDAFGNVFTDWDSD